MAGGYSLRFYQTHGSLPVRRFGDDEQNIANLWQSMFNLAPFLRIITDLRTEDHFSSTVMYQLAQLHDDSGPTFRPPYTSSDDKVKAFRELFATLRGTTFLPDKPNQPSILPVDTTEDVSSCLAFELAQAIIPFIAELRRTKWDASKDIPEEIRAKAKEILSFEITQNSAVVRKLIDALMTRENNVGIENSKLKIAINDLKREIKAHSSTYSSDKNASVKKKHTELQQNRFAFIQMICYQIARRIALLDQEILAAHRKQQSTDELDRKRNTLEKKWSQLNEELDKLANTNHELIKKIRKNIHDQIQNEFYPDFNKHVERLNGLISVAAANNTGIDTSSFSKQISTITSNDCTTFAEQYSELYFLGSDLRQKLQESMAQSQSRDMSVASSAPAAPANNNEQVLSHTKQALSSLRPTAKQGSSLTSIRRTKSEIFRKASASRSSDNLVASASAIDMISSASKSDSLETIVPSPSTSDVTLNTSLTNQIDIWRQSHESAFFSQNQEAIKNLVKEIQTKVQLNDFDGIIATIATKKDDLKNSMGNYGIINWLIHPVNMALLSALQELLIELPVFNDTNARVRIYSPTI